MFFRILSSEWKKMSWRLVGVLLLIGPALSVLVGLGDRGEAFSSELAWMMFYMMTAYCYAMLFYPILTGVITALVCRYEHLGGGWKQLLSLPISRTQLYLAKLTISAILLAFSQVILLIALIVAGKLAGYPGAIPWDIIAKGLLGGWIAILPLAALQLWVSTLWKNFALPLTINVICTIPAAMIVQSSDYGPLYPWAQPLLAMIPSENEMINLSTDTLLYVIVFGFILALVGGLWTFNRREVAS